VHLIFFAPLDNRQGGGDGGEAGNDYKGAFSLARNGRAFWFLMVPNSEGLESSVTEHFVKRIVISEGQQDPKEIPTVKRRKS
jgi:hypothetical protein